MNPLDRPLLIDLVAAVEQGDEDHARQLLALGVRPDVIESTSGWSALHASILHAPSLLPLLLAHSAEPDGPQVLGGTPLSYVVHELGERPDAPRRQQLFEAMDLLLAAGADPMCGGSNQSALELSRLYRMPDVEAWLLKNSRAGRTPPPGH